MQGSRDDIKEQIRERADIVSIVSRHAKLVKTSRGYKACCPLPGHKEKTPSFNVNPATNSYYCFGCNRGGDVFKFLEVMEGLSFKEALTELAAQCHIELPKYTPRTPQEAQVEAQAKTVREEGYEILERAAKYFHTVLMDEATPNAKKAADYLFSRGITEEEIKKLRLGFAPEGTNSLTKKITKKNELEVAMAIGLIGTSPEGGRQYDFFRDRMMIPITDVRGRVIGFSGRLLDPHAKANKYFNSRESEWFKKKTVVYGLDRAAPLIREQGYLCIVEGYFDQWAFARNDIPAVAVMGTALTEDHLALIGRYTKNIILVLDADAAGIASTKKSLPLVMNGDWEVRVFSGFEGKDPDEWLSQNQASVADLKRKIEASSDGLEWLAKNTVKEASALNLNRLQIFGRLKDIWVFAKTEARKNLLADELAPLLGLDRKMIRTSLDELVRNSKNEASRDVPRQSIEVGGIAPIKARPAPRELAPTPFLRAAEEAFVWWLWHWEQLTPRTDEQWDKLLDLFTNTPAESWILLLKEQANDSKNALPLTVVTDYLGLNTGVADNPLLRWMQKGLVAPESAGNDDVQQILTSFEELCQGLLREKVKGEINRLQNELRSVRADAHATARILQRVQDLRIRLEKSK